MRTLAISAAFCAMIFCACRSPSLTKHRSMQDEAELRVVRIELSQLSSMPAAELLYAPHSPHGAILIALYTNRLALIDPDNGSCIRENTLPKRHCFTQLVYRVDEPLLMNSGDGFSDLYVMDLHARILWEYEKHERGTPIEMGVARWGEMTSGDLNGDGEPEFYVSSNWAVRRCVHLLNSDGNFVRVFSEGSYRAITCNGGTFIGTSYSPHGPPFVDFRDASGALIERTVLQTDRVREFHLFPWPWSVHYYVQVSSVRPLDWPAPGNYLALDDKGHLYVFRRDGHIEMKEKIGGTYLNHTIVTAADSDEQYLVVLSTFSRFYKSARLHVFDKNLTRAAVRDVDVTWGICAASRESTEFFLGGSQIWRCRLLEK